MKENPRWTSTTCERCRRPILILNAATTDPVRLKYRKVCGICLTHLELTELHNAVLRIGRQHT